MEAPLDRQTIEAIVAALQDQIVGHPIRYSDDSLWVGEWEALREVDRALEDFRRHGESPISTAVGLILDALLERDPSASRPPVTRKRSPPMLAPINTIG